MIVDTDILIWHMRGNALIAATVENQGETLYTANSSHYDIVPNLSVKGFRPE